MTIKANFSAGTGLLKVIGDQPSNTITMSRNAAGQILINGGAVSIDGGNATVANTTEIDLFGQGGDDTIALDETNGALPSAHLFGGDGNDVLTGGSSADLLFGQSGNDTLLGKAGKDQLFGGDGNDTLIGGAGDDQVFGQAGNDRMIWNPGDGSDLLEGGDGNDTAEVNGGGAAETFTVAANGTRVRFDRTSTNPFFLDIGTTENLVLQAGGGNDVITAGNGLANLIQLTLDGGEGNDTITGGDGNDTLIGGDGNDTVVGGRGKDIALLGNGNDVFTWNPGDGSDTVEGQAGTDTLVFNGSTADETIDISANGSRVLLTRDVGTITMDVNGTETIDVNASDGADNITVNDLTGTDVEQVAIDLGGGAAGGGDGQEDTVSINAPKGAIRVTDHNGVVTVSSLASTVTISNFEADADHLVINDQIVEVTNGRTVTVAPLNSNNTGGTSTASDGSHAADLALLGQFMASSFVVAGDGDGATPIADQLETQQPLLTQPHV
ncbi:MAG: calcium-binding protein [Pseudolabrys sp.]